MRLPSGLKKLDDKVLGERGGTDRADDEPPASKSKSTSKSTTPSGTPGVTAFLAVFWRISKLVLVALGLVVLTAAAFVLLPTNEDNVIVRNVLSLGETVAGPFKDVFSVDDPDRMRVYNYGLAAVVFFVLAGVVGKLPTGGKRRG